MTGNHIQISCIGDTGRPAGEYIATVSAVIDAEMSFRHGKAFPERFYLFLHFRNFALKNGGNTHQPKPNRLRILMLIMFCKNIPLLFRTTGKMTVKGRQINEISKFFADLRSPAIVSPCDQFQVWINLPHRPGETS